jgi:uncharacterized membrane protein
MPFCGKCGTQVSEGTAFCSRCGAPLAAAPQPGAHYGAPPPPPSAPAGAGMAPNVAALLSYVLGFITGIIFLVLEPYKNDRFVRFHAFQSTFFSVALTVFWIVWSQLFWLIPFGFLMTMFGLIGMLFQLGMLLLWLFLMYKAYNGERFMIPVIGDLAAKQAG